MTSFEEFKIAVLNSYLGDTVDSDPRLAAAWWGWQAARGELTNEETKS